MSDHPDVRGRQEDAAALEDARCGELARQAEALGYGPVHLEEHDEVPGEWGAWVGSTEADFDLVGSGFSQREALEDAVAQLEVWRANEGRPSHPRSRFE